MTYPITDLAEWKPDCQQKWDFDGDLVRLSTRMWEAGRSVTIFDPAEPEKGLQVQRSDKIQATAHASIFLGKRSLADKFFEAPTNEEVKKSVEQWAQTQWERIARVLTEIPWPQDRWLTADYVELNETK